MLEKYNQASIQLIKANYDVEFEITLEHSFYSHSFCSFNS